MMILLERTPLKTLHMLEAPPEFFLVFLLNIIIPRKSPPEEENALKNAPLKYAWRSQCPPEIEKAKKCPPESVGAKRESVSAQF